MAYCVDSFIAFFKYHMKFLLWDFNAKIDREDIFKLAIWNKTLHETLNDNGIRVVNFVYLEISKSHILAYTQTSTDGKIYNQIDHILIDRWGYSNILDVRSIRAADRDTTIWRWQNLGRD
jgi:hypothetical protein